MGLFDIIADVVSMPIRIGVDVVKAPGKIMNGEDGILDNTVRGIEKIEEDLEK